jgi:hypothetical protein
MVPNAATTITAYFTMVNTPANTSAVPAPVAGNNLSHRSTSFDSHEPHDLFIEILPARNHYSLRRIRHGMYTLIEGVDYIRDGNTYIITEAFLSTLDWGDAILTFDMDMGGSPQVIVRMLR